VRRLAEALREPSVPLLVVLDNLHRLADRDALAGLATLLSSSPRLRLALTAHGGMGGRPASRGHGAGR
jgi:hypothetical protein